MNIGELFILGFHGLTIPPWVGAFAARYGLGGIILFDYYCQTGKYENNIESPEQVTALCAAIHALPSRPMVFIDQEGGLVRRLKESRGFKPLPSAKDFNTLPEPDKQQLLTASFQEMRALGIDYDFAPVIDVDHNPDNPNIGKIRRAYSSRIDEVEANARLVSAVAAQARVGLCIKHYPGIGGATIDSHQDFMDISDILRPEQEELFCSLAPEMFGNALLVSHAIVRQWGNEVPLTLSAAAIGHLRARLSTTLFVTDDMQMQGLQKALGTTAASLQAVRAGMDMVCIGNNLLNEEHEMSAIAALVERGLTNGQLKEAALRDSIERVRLRKALLI